MKVTGFFVKALPAACAAGILISAGVMCQKPESAKIETPKTAVAVKPPVNDSAMRVGKTIAADMSIKKTDTAAMSKKADTAVAGYYTCPMHPKIHQVKPGKCPICKMDLVFKKAAGTTTNVKVINHSKKKI